MLADKLLMTAVSKILQRSEREPDANKLLETYVDTGILEQLNNKNNQIFYGRRGTGKTHVLRVLDSNLRSEDHIATAYIDARTLGSSAQFTDLERPVGLRCLALFRDIMLPVRDTILAYVCSNPNEYSEKAVESLQDFERALTGTNSDHTDTEVRIIRNSEESVNLGLEVGPVKAGSNDSAGETKELKYTARNDDKVIFPDLHASLRSALRYANVTVYIMIDEWSALPQDLQPYLAEFLRRSILAIPEAVLKIAALEYRSYFWSAARNVGFELGADIAATLHLDDYYVYDKNPESVIDSFSDMLRKHLSIGLPDDYLPGLRIRSGSDLQSRMFTERSVFKELVRASEGVVRDLINIFTKAFFDAARRNRDSIDKAAVISAARDWFEQDKSKYLNVELNLCLQRIVNDVIGTRKARSFLVPRDLQQDRVLQGLFDARVIHIVQRGYADKDNPGMRYDIYTLDYGTYVNLLNTSRQPTFEYVEYRENAEEEFIVPFDDKRSIRRIVLRQEVLVSRGRPELASGDHR